MPSFDDVKFRQMGKRSHVSSNGGQTCQARAGEQVDTRLLDVSAKAQDSDHASSRDENSGSRHRGDERGRK